MAVGEPAVTPASVTSPASVPVIVAASLAPLIVTVTVWLVPSTEVTVKVSMSVPLALSASTAALVSETV